MQTVTVLIDKARKNDIYFYSLVTVCSKRVKCHICHLNALSIALYE